MSSAELDCDSRHDKAHRGCRRVPRDGRRRLRTAGSVVATSLLGVLVLGPAGCGGGSSLQHPLTQSLDPEYDVFGLKTVAALPFASDVSEEHDPDRLAASMVASKFYAALPPRVTFGLLPAEEVESAVARAGKQEAMAKFYDRWIGDDQDVDKDFIRWVASTMQADAVIAGAVDVWYQREIDVTESGSARTQVGAMVGLFDGKTGKPIWFARDENSKDAPRYSGVGETHASAIERQVERSNLRTAGGIYAPPDYAVVVDLVVAALVRAFPAGP